MSVSRLRRAPRAGVRARHRLSDREHHPDVGRAHYTRRGAAPRPQPRLKIHDENSALARCIRLMRHVQVDAIGGEADVSRTYAIRRN